MCPPTPDAGALAAVHHDGGVPAHVGAVAAFDLLVARELGFLVHGNGVHVVRGGDHGNAHGLCTGALQQRTNNVLGTFGALRLNQIVEGLKPFGGLLRIPIRQLASQAATDVRDMFLYSHVHLLLVMGYSGGCVLNESFVFNTQWRCKRQSLWPVPQGWLVADLR